MLQSVKLQQVSRIRQETSSKSRRTENGKKLEMFSHFHQELNRDKHLNGRFCAETPSERLSLGQCSEPAPTKQHVPPPEGDEQRTPSADANPADGVRRRKGFESNTF